MKDIVTDDQLQGLLGDVKADTSRNAGRKYISIYGDVFDPTTDVPNIPDELIEKVTYKDRIYRGFRTEGVYRHEGAEMVVKTEVKVHSEMMADTIEREEYQEINVSAPSIEALKAIYTLVRQGKLAPEENWEQDVLDVPRATTPAETEEKATT
ncbi:MAG: hypothetical protein Q8N98_00565 [bacterium]|nr:hypothetical protein [bacterium]